MKRIDQFNQAFYLHLPNIRQSKEIVGIRRALLRFAIINAYRMFERYHGIKMKQAIFLEMLIYQLCGFTKKGWDQFQSIHYIPLIKPTRCFECHAKGTFTNCTHQCSLCNNPICHSCYLSKHVK